MRDQEERVHAADAFPGCAQDFLALQKTLVVRIVFIGPDADFIEVLNGPGVVGDDPLEDLAIHVKPGGGRNTADPGCRGRSRQRAAGSGR